jgi:hypothetical protein
MHKYANPLKIASLIVAGIGMIMANELQRRETREIVEEVLDEREAERKSNTAGLPS